MFFNGKEITITISQNNVNIKDSYKIKSRSEMREIINKIKNDLPNHVINKMSTFSLLQEWTTHNLLYRLGIYKDRTGSVDLNYGKPMYEKIAYAILGMINYFGII